VDDKQPASVRQVLEELRRKPGFDGRGVLTDEETLPGTHFVRTLAGHYVQSGCSAAGIIREARCSPSASGRIHARRRGLR
jgi:hypothetical protein